MMKNSKKKLTLDKIKIAKLDHLDSFKGGQQEDTDTETFDPEVCFTKPTICAKTVWDCGISTKTVPISGRTCVCI